MTVEEKLKIWTGFLFTEGYWDFEIVKEKPLAFINIKNNKKELVIKLKNSNEDVILTTDNSEHHSEQLIEENLLKKLEWLYEN